MTKTKLLMKQHYSNRAYCSLALAMAIAAGNFLSAQAERLTPSRLELPSFASIKRAKGPAKITPTKNGVIIESAAGFRLKKLENKLNKKIDIRGRKSVKTRAEEGVSFRENFESWDRQDRNWLPEGWTRKATAGLTGENTWCPVAAEETETAIPEGKVMMMCPYNTKVNLDEWLITPAITVAPEDQLNYTEISSPLYMYSFDNVDWDNMEYKGDKVVVADVQVLVSEDDGQNWKVIRSLAEIHKDKTLLELYDVSQGAAAPVNVSLKEYEGKTIKLAFRQQGLDTDAVMIDDISVGKPAVPLIMVNPISQLNFGIGEDFSIFPFGIAHLPADSEITWYNYSETPGATYSWTYQKPDMTYSTKEATEEDPDLTLSYPLMRIPIQKEVEDFLHAPVLNGKCEGFSPNSTSINDILSIGGRASIDIPEDEVETMGTDELRMGATGPNIATDDFNITTNPANNEPVLGYAPHADDFWSDYTFQGDQNQDNWVKLIKLLNINAAPDAPMTIYGGWIPAYGEFTENAEFKFEILPVTEEGEISTEPLASATIKGSEVAVDEESSLAMLSFNFSQPLVMSTELCEQYVLVLSGFNDPENVTFFAPFHSVENDSQDRVIGWTWKQMCQNGNLNYSLAPIANVTGKANGFYFMLDADYGGSNSNAAVEGIDAGINAPVEYYNLQGIRIAAPAKGETCIMRQGSRSVKIRK